MISRSLIDQFEQAIGSDDITKLSRLLSEHAGLFNEIPPDAGCLIGKAMASCRSAAMVDLLLEHGARPRNVSEFWAPGFGLSNVLPEIADYLIKRGAAVTPHALAALGLTARLSALLDTNAELVTARGGDGARPLHFSRNIEVARLLLERGAEIDPQDEDHDSTPAQWRIGDAPEVTRFLLERGAAPDIFMAAALGDLGLVERLVSENPDCTTYRIGNNHGPFPGIGFQDRGGTIYQWTLGFNQSPHEIALRRGHRQIFDFLMSRTPRRQQFLVACWMADRERAERLAEANPGLVGQLDAEDLALLAKSCWETNLNPGAVRLMLDLGFPVDAPEFNHGYKPLHNAAWCGHAELVELLIQNAHPINERDPNHGGTPLGWAVHSCVAAKRHPEGNFPKVLRLLLQAGATIDEKVYPTGHKDLDDVLKKYVAPK